MDPRNRDIHSLETLRAVAATSVVLYHLTLVGRGSFGVDIFFVISGFIVVYITQGGGRDFLAKRIFRIVPLYWAATLLLFAVSAVLPSLMGSTVPNGIELAKSLFFIPYEKGSGDVRPLLFVGWTLNYEMFFYAIYALALRYVPQRAPLFASVILVALVVAGMVAPFKSVPLAFYSDPIVLNFVLGILAFHVWHRHQAWLASLSVPLALTIFALFYALLFSDLTFEWWRPAGLGLPSLAVVLALLAVEGRVTFPRWALLIGASSYSLYLLHPFVVALFERVLAKRFPGTASQIVLSVGALLGSFAVAILSYRLWEYPSNAYLRARFLSPRRRAAPPVEPEALPARRQ